MNALRGYLEAMKFFIKAKGLPRWAVMFSLISKAGFLGAIIGFVLIVVFQNFQLGIKLFCFSSVISFVSMMISRELLDYYMKKEDLE